MKNKELKSQLTLTAAMLIFGTIAVFRRNIALPSAVLSWARGVLGCLFLLLIVVLKGKKPLASIARKDIWKLMLSGALIGFNWMLLFEAYDYTSVASATLCYYMAPTIIIMLSTVVFGEKLTFKQMVCAGVSLCGMVLISGVRSGDGDTSLVGRLYGLAAALLYAIVVITNKTIVQGDAFDKTMIQLGCAALALVPYILLTEDLTTVSLSAKDIALTCVMGIVHTGLAFAMYFGTLSHLKARSMALISYVDPVSALLLSWTVLGEKFTVLGALGAVMIIGAALVSELKGGNADA